MALLFVDGFDHYSIAEITKKWTFLGGSSPAITSEGRRGSGCFKTSNTGSTAQGYIYRVVAPTASTTLIVGFALEVKTQFGNTTTNQEILGFWDGVTTSHIAILATGTGAIAAYRGTGGTLLGTSATMPLTLDASNYIEVKATVHDTTGAIEVRVNGSPVLTLTNVDTRNAGTAQINMIRIGQLGSSGGSHYRYDDLYVCDTTGSTNNDFLGDVRVDTLYPSADGTYTDFTPSGVSGAHRYWRVYWNENNQTGAVYCSELQLRETAGGANAIPSASNLTAAPSLSGSNPLTNTQDGNPNTNVNFNNGSPPYWFTCDFGAGNEKEIVQVAYQGHGTISTTAPAEFFLQFSDDNAYWQTTAASAYSVDAWTASEIKLATYSASSTHYTRVDEDGRTRGGQKLDVGQWDYVEGIDVGDRDSYAFQDLQSLVSSQVFGVQVNAAVSKDDAGIKTIATFIRSGGTNGDGATVVLGTGLTYQMQLYELNPNGSVAWTQATVNAAEFGVKVVA